MSQEPPDGELFAGPGGWDVAARLLGVHPKGLEWDDAACATAQAAGHYRFQVQGPDGKLVGLDVAAMDPESLFPYVETVKAWIRLLIGSPPCQAFSAAGKGKGRKGVAYILMGVNLIAWGNDPVQVCKWVDEKLDDPRAALVLEPLRWAKALRPAYIALEQVPAVLPLWESMAEVLRSWGYSVWCGNLQAEQYDVPQTRKRAILIASRVRPVSAPTPVRYKFRKGTAQNEVHKLDTPGLKPWISMVQALGWDDSAVMRSNYGTGGDPEARGERTTDQPAPTVTSKIDRNMWQRRNSGPGAARDPRPANSPSYTIRAQGSGSHPSGVEWTQHRTGNTPVRVTVQEAAVLQGFPSDYPWQGTKSAQYRQVGDAMPPPLAWHVLRALFGLPVQHYPGTEDL